MATRNLESPCSHLHCYFNSARKQFHLFCAGLFTLPLCFVCLFACLFTNDSKRLHIQMNYSGGPNIVYCEACMLSSCLTIFVLLWCCNVHKMVVPVRVNAYWYDNYGLADLQQLQDLTHSQWFVGLLILGISALMTAITSVTVVAISLT